MKAIFKHCITCAVTVVGLVFAGNSSAATLSAGSLVFAGSVTLDGTSPATATQITQFFAIDGMTAAPGKTQVQSSHGSLSVTNGTLLDAPTSLTFGSGAAGLFQTTILGDLYTFDLQSSTFEINNVSGVGNFLNLIGKGIISGPGIDPTPASLTLTVTPFQTGGRFGVAGTIAVPDGGSALALLGIGLVGIEGLRRRLVKTRA